MGLFIIDAAGLYFALEQGKPEELTTRIIASMDSEIEKLRVRGESRYTYMTEELIPVWSRGFAIYYQKITTKTTKATLLGGKKTSLYLC